MVLKSHGFKIQTILSGELEKQLKGFMIRVIDRKGSLIRVYDETETGEGHPFGDYVLWCEMIK
jgi:hypothetical protein